MARTRTTYGNNNTQGGLSSPKIDQKGQLLDESRYDNNMLKDGGPQQGEKLSKNMIPGVPPEGSQNTIPLIENNNTNGPPTYESFQERTFPKLEGALSRYLPKKFGYDQDYIELHIYDQDGNLLFSDENFQEYSKENIETTNLTNELDIDPVYVLRTNGYTSGKYNVVFNIQRKKFFNTFDKTFIVKEISSNRREIKVIAPSINNASLARYYNDFKNELTSTPFFKDFVINFGNDEIVPCINIGLNKRKEKSELLLKSLDKMPGFVNIDKSFRISEFIIDRLVLPVDLGVPSRVDYGVPLQGPNFKIDVRLNSSIPSEFLNYNELLESQVSGSYERLLSELNSKEIPSIDYDYIRPISSSLEDSDESFHFENFVHFGSAVERLKNFHYKIKLIELYNSQIGDINTITGDTSASVVVLDNKSTITQKREKVLKGFDGYEKFLYYNTGSVYSWPKNPTTITSGSHTLYSISSSQIQTWIGDERSEFPNYGGQLKSASLFDRQNPHNLERLIPSFIQENKSNDQYTLFYHMIGQHFDHIWTYIKHITNQKNTHHVRGVSKDLVYYTLKSLGVETFDQFENANLIEYILGQGTSGSNYYDTTHTSASVSSETLITASNDGSIPKGDITKNIWKRLYHNAPYLLKTKGTERGIRALMSCYGVPSTILNIKEYGGSTEDKGTYQTFSYDKSSLALKGTTPTGNGYWIKTDWSSSLTDALSSSAKTVEFRIKPTRISGDHLLFLLSGSEPQNDPILRLEHYTGTDVSESNDSTDFGRLTLYSDGVKKASSSYFPAFNGDFWDIFIGTSYDSASSSDIVFGAYQANFNKNTYFTTSSFEIGEVTRSLTWGDPHVDNDNKGGALHAYFGGVPLNAHASYNNIDNLNYSGSMQEIRYYFGELLSHKTLIKHSLTPFMYAGNTSASAYDKLVFRLPLGSNNIQDTSSFHPNIDQDYIPSSSISSLMTTPVYEEIEEIHHLISPDTVGISMTSEKVRIDEGTIDSNILSPFVKSETSMLDRQPPDYEDLGVFLSPTNEINEDIIYTLGAFRLDDYIGSPLPSAQTASNYEDLKSIKDLYFKKVKRRYNYWEYIKQIQYIDHTLFKLIEQFVPMKANTKTGLLIEPHFLERTKFARELPVINDNQTMVPGSFNTINYEIEPNTSFTIQSSSVVTTNNLTKLASRYYEAIVGEFVIGDYEVDHTYFTSPKRKEEGTNTTINISTFDPDRVILNEIPNTTYNTQFAQAPIQPYISTKPDGYKAYKSNTLLGNATKTKKSSIYYRSLDKGKELDF
tara:strand:- start:7578 stop:11414 length:3837 start_codon:yes stop_codon:yes gene_type:complete